MSTSNIIKHHSLAGEMITEVYEELKNKKAARVDKQNQGTKVKGYWCGPVLRIDIQFAEETR